MSWAEILGEPDRLAFLLLLALVVLSVGAGVWMARQRGSGDAQTGAVATWPYLVRLELVAGLATLLVVSWWAIGLPLPLGVPADPSVTPAQAKAPWFFVGIQELLQYFDPWLAGVVLPLVGLLGLAALPYLETDPGGAGHVRLRPAALVALAGLLGLWLVPAGVGLFLRGDNWMLQPLWRAPLPQDDPMPLVLGSLGERLGLGPSGAQLLGAVLCLGPFLLLAIGTARLRKRAAAQRLRLFVAGSFLLILGGVVIKVVLVAALGARYLWVTPWFRI
jgi:hypothetical protein